MTTVSNALLLSIINTAADDIVKEQVTTTHFLSYFLFGGIYLYTRHHLFDKFFFFIDGTVARLQDRLGNKIRHTELSTLEKVGASSIYARLTEDMTYLSLISWSLMRSIHAIFVMLSILLYIATLSGWAFVAVLIGVSASVVNFIFKADETAKNYFDLAKKETLFLNKLNHLLEGFKEMKINGKKSNQVFSDYEKASTSRGDSRMVAFQFYNINTSFAYACFFVMITAVVFVLPHYHSEYPETIIKITAAILFIFGPIESLLNALPSLAIAEYGVQNILGLEKELDSSLKSQKKKMHTQKTNNETPTFRENIQLENLIYEYEHQDSAHAFGIGPMTIRFQKGEIIFITGGNGSGKSTFLKMFTGLYVPKSGEIYLDRDLKSGKDGTLITAANYTEYRNLFTTLFTDFHLFDRLYGLEDTPEKEVNDLLRRMGLSEQKAHYQNGRFSNIQLSSGQKKRLALIICILEDKDIYILDEVAADLDPDFRDVYYYEILQELKARQKTVFVVSHDKDYWDAADRIIELKKGQFHEHIVQHRTVSKLAD
ncbi:MAG: ATP-binding cassette domain-containing protein [Chitinophagales bacterium]